MSFPINTYRISEEEINAVLQSVAEQIADPESNKTFGKDVVARVFGHAHYKEWGGDRKPRHFNQDAIWVALGEIRKAGWHCWQHVDYMGELSIWITASDMCPHVWYSRC